MTPRDALDEPDKWGKRALTDYRLLMAEAQETIHRTTQLIEESQELLRRFELASDPSLLGREHGKRV
jgi:hypothetical protein